MYGNLIPIFNVSFSRKTQIINNKKIIMENPTNITLDIYNACRTNTGRAIKNNGHYNFPILCKISGFNADDLQWCAEHREDTFAIETIKHVAEALLSAYELQRKTYK